MAHQFQVDLRSLILSNIVMAVGPLVPVPLMLLLMFFLPEEFNKYPFLPLLIFAGIFTSPLFFISIYKQLGKHTLTIGPDSIANYNTQNKPDAARWEQIQEVIPIQMLFSRILWLKHANGTLILPLSYYPKKEIPNIKAAILEFAPEGHPLRKYIESNL